MIREINHKQIRRKYPDIPTRRAVTKKLKRRIKQVDRNRIRTHSICKNSSNENPTKYGLQLNMDTDFCDAHDRHWEDAESLFDANRLANSDHLFGISAECGLKSLMYAFGMDYDFQRDRPQHMSDRKHANAIWDRYDTYRSGHHAGSYYALSSPNRFQDWNASQRYANRNNFDHSRVRPHREGALEVRQLLKKAKRDGLI